MGGEGGVDRDHASLFLGCSEVLLHCLRRGASEPIYAQPCVQLDAAVRMQAGGRTATCTRGITPTVSRGRFYIV